MPNTRPVTVPTTRRADAKWVWLAAVAIGAAYFLFPNVRIDFTPFNAHDSESYIALSRSLLEGRGYTRSLDAAIYIPHTTWPPGLPLILMPSVWIAGLPADLLPIKLTMIAIAVAGLFLAVAYALRTTGAPAAGFMVLFGLGLNPYYWHFARVALTEVPTFVWAIVSLLLIDTAYADQAGVGRVRAYAIGLVCGFGMMIRGSFLGMILAPAAQIAAARAWPGRRQVIEWLIFAAGFATLIGLWALRNRTVDTSGLGLDGIDQFRMIAVRDPVDPTSPVRSFAQIAAGIISNIKWQIIYNLPRQVIPGLWPSGLWRMLGPAAPFLAAILSAAIVAAALSRRGLPLLVTWGPMALLYTSYSWGGSERFWTTISFLIVVAIALAWGPRLQGLQARTRRGILALVAMAGLASLGTYAAQHERQPFYDSRFAALAGLFDEIRDRRIEIDAVYTPNPHAFRLMTGRSAPMALIGRGIDPVFSHVIFDRRVLSAPAALGQILIERENWLLVALTHPMSASVLVRVLPHLEYQ